MTPTLAGRIQTRVLLLGTVGLLWTIIVVPILPRFGAPIGDVYAATITAIVIVAILGIGWEALYHLIQQYRWEKDWPILFGLLTGIPESIVTLVVVSALFVPSPNVITFFLHFFSTWIVVWLVANGPLRVVLLRWRFNGGRIV